MLWVVDDDSDFANVLVRILRRYGYSAEAMNSGADLLVSLEYRTPGLILLDVMMPNISGLDVLARMRADSRYAGIPVIIFTAGTTTETEARDVGATDFLQKGNVKLPEIVSRIGRFLPQDAQRPLN